MEAYYGQKVKAEMKHSKPFSIGEIKGIGPKTVKKIHDKFKKTSIKAVGRIPTIKLLKAGVPMGKIRIIKEVYNKFYQ